MADTLKKGVDAMYALHGEKKETRSEGEDLSKRLISNQGKFGRGVAEDPDSTNL